MSVATPRAPEGSTINHNGLLAQCDPCRRCPLYKGSDGCCATGESFDKHPNLPRLVKILKEATSESPQTLGEITLKVVQKTGNKMNFRGKKIVGAVMCALHRMPEICIDKTMPSKPLYYKGSDCDNNSQCCL